MMNFLCLSTIDSILKIFFDNGCSQKKEKNYFKSHRGTTEEQGSQNLLSRAPGCPQRMKGQSCSLQGFLLNPPSCMLLFLGCCYDSRLVCLLSVPHFSHCVASSTIDIMACTLSYCILFTVCC